MSILQDSVRVLTSACQLDLTKTFECGQCFRWNSDSSGVYTGVSCGRVLHIWQQDEKILCDCPEDELPFWEAYFDLKTDYRAASELFTQPDYLKTCARYGDGIRILRQEPWEALCSFIISQCNNIPRIKKIVETLCRLFGEPLEGGLYSFPSAEKLSPLSEADLVPLRCGYRAAYILDAARAVASGLIDYKQLSILPASEARSSIKGINGVGDKVANCFMLYGLHRMDSFPIDTWMKKALKQHFPADYDPSVLGEFAGLAQQYIFYFARSGEIE